MEHLKALGITEDDFRTIAEALEKYPHTDTAGNMMGDLLLGVVTSDAPDHVKAKMEHEKEMRHIEQKAKVEARKDEVRNIMSKMYVLKNYLLDNGIIKS